MSIFYFNLHECGVVVEDREGVELPDFESATIRAIHEARMFMASEVANGHLCLGCHIEIAERETGQSRIVHFRDVLNIVGIGEK